MLWAEIKSQFKSDGTVMIEDSSSFISPSQMERLKELANSLPVEHVEVGDANEPNFLDVGRFMTDVEMPMLVNRPLSEEALEIVQCNEIREFFRYLLDSEHLVVRRMQYNILNAGCFVGLHLDTDSNPDYMVAVVIQFGDDFKGGDYVVYGGGKPPRVYKPTRNSIIISDCKYEHEVTKVTSGSRKSLVFFLSEKDGLNSRIAS